MQHAPSPSDRATASDPSADPASLAGGRWLRGRNDDPVVQFARYVVVGGAAFVVDFGTLALLHRVVGVHYLLSAAVGFTVGLVVNYLVSVRWVFTVRRVQRRSVELSVYALVGVVGLLLNQLTIGALTAGLGLDPLVSKLVAGAVVLAWNFGARKLALF